MEEIWLTLFDPSNKIYQLLIAVFLGAFIGLRRELYLQKSKTQGLMGLRTVPLLVLLGTLSTFFPQMKILPLIVFLGVAGYILVAYINGVFNLKKIGLTTEVTGLIMFLVGVLIGNGEIFMAIVITMVVAIINAYKMQFHNFAKQLSLKEWTGGLQLLIVSLIVLPILPKTAVDPWGIIIPFNIWLFVVLISAIGFIGYFLNKYLGEHKSMSLTSVLGSLVSSTIVTTTLAMKSKKEKMIDGNLFLSALLLSLLVMEIKSLVAILILSRGFYLEFVLAVSIMMGVTILLFLYLHIRNRKQSQEIESLKISPAIKSPFELIPALKFAFFFVVMLFLIHFTKNFFSNYGIYIVTSLSAFVDSDAPILSILESFHNGGVGKAVVWRVITLVVLANTLSKIIYIYAFGRRDIFKKVVIYFSIVLLSGLSVFLIL